MLVGDSNVCYTAGGFKGGKRGASLPNCRLAAAVTHWRQVFDFASAGTGVGM
jgi:hypothetical protein